MPVAEALQSRLEVLETEILRLTKQASGKTEQDNYYRLAQYLQREAREIRVHIGKTVAASTKEAPPPQAPPPQAPPWKSGASAPRQAPD